MKKVFFFISFFVLISVSLFRYSINTIILIQFTIERDRIAKELCVQREKADNCCQGSCQLNLRLEEQKQKEATPSYIDHIRFSEVLFVQNIENLFQITLTENRCDYIIQELIFILKKDVQSVFHPPPVIA